MARFEPYCSSGIARLASLAGLFFLLASAVAAQAQTFTVLHRFTGGGDGASPQSGLTIDAHGRLYGNTNGFPLSDGSVFKVAEMGSGWILSTLNDFNGNDGSFPYDNRMVIGPDGNLYGATASGGQGTCNGGEFCGVVFRLQPPRTACRSFVCPWTETVLYSFTGGSDGGNPLGDLVADSEGNLYGVTWYGGDLSGCGGLGCGVVYKLAPSGNGWTETVIHAFGLNSGQDGLVPSGGLTFDPAGNLYGVTARGGSNNHGTVYELSPSAGGWSETILHNFQSPAQYQLPGGALARDAAGNLYGVTGGDFTYGSLIFALSQPGTWTYSVLYTFGSWRAPSELTLDGAGNLYGTVTVGGPDSVFELSRSNGGWSYIDLHDFSQSDGVGPNGVAFDANGNLYGTTSSGGDLNCPPGYFSGCGTVWEITPH